MMMMMYLHTIVFCDAVQNSSETIQVPEVLVTIKQGTRYVCTVDRRIERHVLPILPFQLINAVISRRCISIQMFANKLITIRSNQMQWGKWTHSVRIHRVTNFH